MALHFSNIMILKYQIWYLCSRSESNKQYYGCC